MMNEHINHRFFLPSPTRVAMAAARIKERLSIEIIVHSIDRDDNKTINAENATDMYNDFLPVDSIFLKVSPDHQRVDI